MSHEHELSKYRRNGNRVDLDKLLEMGQAYQDKTGWRPTNPAKNSGVPVEKPPRPRRSRSAGGRGPAAAQSPPDRVWQRIEVVQSGDGVDERATGQ